MKNPVQAFLILISLFCSRFASADYLRVICKNPNFSNVYRVVVNDNRTLAQISVVTYNSGIYEEFNFNLPCSEIMNDGSFRCLAFARDSYGKMTLFNSFKCI